LFLSHGRKLEAFARDYPDRLAMVCENRRLTYFQFNRRINRLAHALMAMGLQKGDKVALLNTNAIETVESIYAVLKAGGVLVPLNPMVKGESLRKMIDNSDCVILICGQAYTGEIDRFKPRLPKIGPDRYICISEEEVEGYIPYNQIQTSFQDTNPQVENLPEDVFNIMYSSGTTGLPKGIVHTHHFRFASTLMGAVEFMISTQSVVLNSTPLYHNGSLLFVLPTLFLGGTLILMEKFDPGPFLTLVHQEKVTHAYLVPTQFIGILAHPDLKAFDTSSLKVLLSMAAPLSKKTKSEILENFDCDLFELYGVTEGGATVLRPFDQHRKIGSVGKGLWTQVRIVDEGMEDVPAGDVGEIILNSGDLAMEGYYKNPELTAQTVADKWIKTGDLGRFDAEGYLYVVGRKKDMIISGGVNIYPEDIEEVIFQHPKVLEAAVFGVPHEKWGETPLAAVVLKDNRKASSEEIKAWVNEQVPKYQRISTVIFIDRLPRNPAGKILKRELRKTYGAKHDV